ncbi:MAG: site-2 protease family protein [Candidatus Gastranaerophilales bacterium]|nr:site-2 protease family protein [Candidatus Gastranaerophilales bacterium]
MSIIIMLLLLSLLIIVHEAGHFIAAKSFGIKVDKFGFGLPLGPTLFEKKVGDVTVLVHALLLGGYVSFAEDDKDCNLPEDSPQRFMNKPVWQRLIIVSAGVIANVICAFFLVLLPALAWHHLPSGAYDVTVSHIVAPKDASVWNSGLRTGDRIVTVNNTKITSTSVLLAIVQLSKGSDGLVDPDFVQSNLARLKRLNPGLIKDEIIPPDVVIRLPEFLSEKPVSLDEHVAMGLKPYKDNQYKLSSKITKLRDTIGNLQNSTYYVSNGHYTLNDVAEAISDNVKPLNMVVERDGKYIRLKTIYPAKSGAIGIQLDSKEQLKPTKSFFGAISGSIRYLSENTYLMVVGLKQALTGEVPLKDLHGIVVITKVGGDIINNSGIFYGLLLTAIISMDLAIVNFLPIPALDGGQALFLILEKIRGKRVSDKIVEKVATISFFLLIGLMIFVIFNDIYALVTQKL